MLARISGSAVADPDMIGREAIGMPPMGGRIGRLDMTGEAGGIEQRHR